MIPELSSEMLVERAECQYELLREITSKDLLIPHPTIYRLRWHRKPYLMVDLERESRIRRDVNVEEKEVDRFVQASSPSQPRPILNENQTEQEVPHKGDDGMHVLECYYERMVRMQ